MSEILLVVVNAILGICYMYVLMVRMPLKCARGIPSFPSKRLAFSKSYLILRFQIVR